MMLVIGVIFGVKKSGGGNVLSEKYDHAQKVDLQNILQFNF